MIFSIRLSANRKYHTAADILATTSIALVLVVGFGSHWAEGLVIGPGVATHNRDGENGQAGAGKLWLDVTDLKPLDKFEKAGDENNRRWIAEVGSKIDIARQDDDVLWKRYNPTYDERIGMCVCDGSRSYAVPAGLPENERMRYCVQICGPPIVGVSSTTATTATTSLSSPGGATSTPSAPSATPTSSAEQNVPTGPTGPAASTASTSSVVPPTLETPPVDDGRGIENQNNGDGGATNINVHDGDDSTGLKIGVGVSVGVTVSGLIALGIWLFLRRRKQKKEQAENFGCIGDMAAQRSQSSMAEHRIGEKYIYAATPINRSTNTGFGNGATPPSPGSIPPAYSAPPGGTIPVPSSTNSSSTSINTNPPVLPLGAPSRAIELDSSAPRFVPGNLTNSESKHQHKLSTGSLNGSSSTRAAAPVQPPSITFFLHPVSNDTDLEDEERRWLSEEQRRIREKKEAVEELERLREEENRIREKIKERLARNR